MTDNGKKRKLTIKYKSANPLFEQWLTEWKEEAKEKGSKMEYTYRNALCSLKKCPIPLNTGQECKILKGFGNHLCNLLDQKLRQHKRNSQNNDEIGLDTVNVKENNDASKNSQPSKKICKKGSSKNLGKKFNSNDQKANTNIDIDDIPTCLGEPSGTNLKRHVSNETDSQNSQATSVDEDFYVLEPGNFDIVLYIDTSEVNSDSSDPLLKELGKISDVCQFEVKKLHIGDYLWICRDKISKKELVLPYIIERKRLDDFASSIKDGRYKEQKFRLKRCGIENKYYLIENCKVHISFPESSMQQAAINTAIQDGFNIKFTQNLSHTAKYLNKFSKFLKTIFENKTLIFCSKENLGKLNLEDDLISLMSFKAFNQSSVKNKPMNVTELFVKMLIQIKGMSVQKALAITQVFPTPLLLKKAIDDIGADNIQKQLTDLSYNSQKIGAPLSKIVIQLFTLNTYK